ncbi:MAG: ATP-dependent DNA ligase [Bacteroidota bacterium]
MKRFTQLYKEIDASTKTNVKLGALVDYLQNAPEEDRLWAIALFTHRRPKRTIKTNLLRAWAAEAAGLSTWLFEESYHVVGDLAETISLILPDPSQQLEYSLSEWIGQIMDQKDRDEADKRSFVLDAWAGLNKDERFLFNKLITGGFRIGVSQKMITKAISRVINEDENKVAHRLMGDWSPTTTTYHDLLVDTDWSTDHSKPYPFYLAYALEEDVATLGDPRAWQAEWKWDGIRSQLIRRKNELFLWSRGEELVTDKYPEFNSLQEIDTPDFVIDGELLVWKDGAIQPFGDLQKRIGRKTVGKKILKDYPVAIYAYDLLEYDGVDLREHSMERRREVLNSVISEIQKHAPDLLHLSPIVSYESWAELTKLREQSRAMKAEGFMLKAKSGTYKSGRRRGEWWKWKVDPYTVDAVMLYAQRGHGRRSNLFTDFTFAVWKDDETLVPFTKAYSGLTDKEFGEVTRWVNKNTIERFGPVRSVNPELVFELAFEGINKSSRHKSGIALRFPRIKRWRRDKPATEANRLTDLLELLE